MKIKGLLFSVSLVLLAVLTGCNFVFSKEVQKEKIDIAPGEANQLSVDLSIGAGELILTGGASDWVNGEIHYNENGLEPDVKVDQKRGDIRIDQSQTNVNFGRKTINEWDLQLTDGLPIDLDIEAGASKSDLDLFGLHLNSLDVESGVGKLKVDLSGDWKESFKVNVESGVGKTTFILPNDVGVRIKADSGVGKTTFDGFIAKGDGVYVNEAYGKADVTIEIQADVGVGKTVFQNE